MEEYEEIFKDIVENFATENFSAKVIRLGSTILVMFDNNKIMHSMDFSLNHSGYNNIESVCCNIVPSTTKKPTKLSFMSRPITHTFEFTFNDIESYKLGLEIELKKLFMELLMTNELEVQ